MNRPAIDELWEYALGTAGEEACAEIDRDLATSGELRAELAEVSELAGAVALAVEPVSPPPAARDRLLAALEADRFGAYARRLMSLFDLGRERVDQILRAIDDASAEWIEGPIQGFFAYHLDGGPRAAAADCGLIRMKPGTYFPHHRHQGQESVVLLQGSYRDLTDDVVVRAGDVVTKPPGSVHDYVAEPGPDCIFAVALEVGFELVAGEDGERRT